LSQETANDGSARHNLARILVRYCVNAQSAETIGVTAPVVASPLVLAVYEELMRCGAFPALRMQPDEATETFYRCGRKENFTRIPPFARAFARSVDKTIDILADSNTRALTGIDPKKIVQASKTMRPVQEILRKKPWVLTMFPTLAYAQDAEMSLHEYEDFVYAATFADEPDPVAAWRAVHRDQARLIRRLAGADAVRIVGPGTDLRLSVKGRTFINSDGHRNMPSGEVFTGPLEDSAEGVIEYDFPVCHRGREVDGVRLVFRKGLIVERPRRRTRPSCCRCWIPIPARAASASLASEQTAAFSGSRNRSCSMKRSVAPCIWPLASPIRKPRGQQVGGALGHDQGSAPGGTLYVNGKAFQKDGRFI